MRPKYSQKRYHKSTRKTCACEKSLSFNFGEIMSSTEMQEALRIDEMQRSETDFWEVMPKDSLEIYRERRQQQSQNEEDDTRSDSREEERRNNSRKKDKNNHPIRKPDRKKSAKRIKQTRKKTLRRRRARSTSSDSSCWFDE